MQLTEEKQEVILRLARDPRLAHAALFAHRHPQQSSPFHHEMVDLWHSSAPRVLTMAFRGAAKSTTAEEAMCVMACLQKFKNGLILGESEARANERLAAIKNEFETNEFIREIFGDLVGEVWQQSKIVLANGVCIQAFGRGQSLRGAKHLQWRPDLVLGDDMESQETVETPEAREKFKNWFMKVVLPALAPGYKFRIAGTPLDPEAWVMKLKNNKDWVTRMYPIEYIDPETGERKSSWPDRWPLEEIDKLKENYYDLGATQQYMQEYMCEASDPATKAFTANMVKVEPQVKTWQAVYGFYDPARTIKRTSAETGFAAWSWVNNRLIVWEAYGHLWMPDQIVADIFKFENEYHPVLIGVEETGLSQFLMQPIRQEQIRRGYAIPVKPLNAPKGKIDFIKGLQTFFKAGEIIFAKPLEALEKQLLAFPTGRMDIVNALAYALKMRPGAPLYDNFSINNIQDGLEAMVREEVYLAINATAQYTTAVAVQMFKGGLRILADWVQEGDPGAQLTSVVQTASMHLGRSFKVVAGPQHFATHDAIGLRAACAKIPIRVSQGGAPHEGRETLRGLFKQAVNGQLALQVNPKAQWTLNGFSGGYARKIERSGMISDFAEDNAYKVLMEGLESFATLLQLRQITDYDTDMNYDYTPDGRRYLSSRAK